MASERRVLAIQRDGGVKRGPAVYWPTRFVTTKNVADLEKVRERRPRKPRESPTKAQERRNADRIDGYDRDNLGESPDW